MFSLYDTITAVKTLKPFSEVIKEKIFIPFNMENASTGFRAFEASNNKAFPHYGSNGNYQTLKLNNRYYSTIPAAGVNASISDLAQFLMVLLNKDSEIVNNHVREIVFTPQVNSPLSRNYFRHWKNVKSKQYAIGWRTVEYGNRNVAYHGGYVQGYRAEIALCFDENVGIAFLSNSPNSIGTKSVPAFLDLIFAQKDLPKFQHTKP
jgi:beta-lactamase class C